MFSYVNRQYRDQLQDYDLNHAPGNLGRCNLATLSNPLAPKVLPVGPEDPDFDPMVAPGDGILDDCIGEMVDPVQAQSVPLLQLAGAAGRS